MNMDPMSAFTVGKSLKKNPLSSAIGGAMEDFKTKKTLENQMALEAVKSQMMSPKDRASMDLMKAQKDWMSGLSSDPSGLGEGMVLDSYSKSGPRFINAKSRLLQKEAGAQATALPKLDRAFDAVQQLKMQHASSLKPVSVKSGSNPFMGGIKKLGQGWSQNVSAMAGTNPELNRYLANRGGFASLISKGGFLEAGVLTEGDINRMLNILPSEYSTQEESDIAWREIENTLSSARKKYEMTQQSMFSGAGRADVAQDASIDDIEAKKARIRSKYYGQ